MSNLEQDVPSKPNTQIALETLKNLIVENELPAGSSHLESELAQKLGMSRTPIREATLILEAQGLLEVVPRRGVKILAVSTRDMLEIYQVLTALEGLAVELAANLKLPNEAFWGAEQAIEQMDAALREDRLEDWAVADEEFHNELVRLCGNGRIEKIVAIYNNQVRRARSVTLYLRPRPIQSNEAHRNVLNAMLNGDAKLARLLHTDHRVQSCELLTGILDKFGFRHV